MTLIDEFEDQFEIFIRAEMTQDLAHDMNHVMRVVKMAKQLCQQEGAIEEIVVPAAYLHDCFSFEKNHPDRAKSSIIAADKAVTYLKSIDYPDEFLHGIHHAVEAHSFTANIATQTLEEKVVQDADRLDALGAIGIARCIQVSAKFGRSLYSNHDAFCDEREPDDGRYTVDHFYAKLLNLAATMKTQSAQQEAEKRTTFMKDYLDQLATEVH